MNTLCYLVVQLLYWWLPMVRSQASAMFTPSIPFRKGTRRDFRRNDHLQNKRRSCPPPPSRCSPGPPVSSPPPDPPRPSNAGEPFSPQFCTLAQHPTYGPVGYPSIRQLVGVSLTAPSAVELVASAQSILAYAHAPSYGRQQIQLYSHFQSFRNLYCTSLTTIDSVLAWAMIRLRTANASTVANKYITAVSNQYALEFPHQPLLSSFKKISLFRRALRKLSLSDLPSRQAAPASLQDVKNAIVAAPPDVAAVIVVAFVFASRVGDVLSLRQGGLYLLNTDDPKAPEGVVMHLPSTKTHPFGLPSSLYSRLPCFCRDVLRPFVSLSVSSSISPARCLDHPPLFPGVTTRRVAEVLSSTSFGKLTAHSLRRGAIQHMLSAGVSLEDATLYTLHRSLEGLAKYVGHIPPQLMRRFVEVSRLRGF